MAVAYIISGLLSGFLVVMAIIRFEKNWQQLLCSASGILGWLPILLSINSYFKNMNATPKPLHTSIFLLSYFIALVGIFIGVCYLIKKQSEKVKIRVLDIVLGYHKVLEIYYEQRKKEVDNDLDYDELERKKNELEKREKNVLESEKNINENMKNILEQGKDKLYLTLPIGKQKYISSEFVNQLDCNVQAIVNFITKVDSITSVFSKKKCKNKDQKFLVCGYLVAICEAVNNVLFDSYHEKVRTHIRIADTENYITYLVMEGGDKIEQELTPIPKKDDSMIKAAIEENRSLIKSVNPEHHYRGKNDAKWVNYITFVPLMNDDKVLSIGISIADENMYNNFLYLLNYCHVEKYIRTYFETFNDKYNILNIITEEENE